MTQKFSLHGSQFFILVTLYMIGSAVLVMPSVLSVAAKRDAWISVILVISAGQCFTWLVYKVYKRFPEKNLVEITREVFGQKVGTVISFLFFTCFTFLLCTFTLRSLGDFVVTVMIPDTPIGVIELAFLLVVIMGVKYGLRTTAYAAEIFFPWVILLSFILFIALLSEVKLDFIRPVFDQGMKPVIRAAIPHTGFPFMEGVLFLMVACHIKRGERVGKLWFMAIAASGIFLLSTTLLSSLVIGPDQTAISVFPAFELAKHVQIGRLEVFMTFIWFVTVFIRLTLLFYVTVIGLAETLKWREYKFFCFPLAILVVEGSVIFMPSISYKYELTSIWVYYAFIWGVCFPVLLLVLPKLQRNKLA